MRKALRTRGSMVLKGTIALAIAWMALGTGEAQARFYPPVIVPPKPEVPKPPPPLPPPPPEEKPPTDIGGGTPPGDTQKLPEPATLITGLLGSGIAGIAAALRRRREKGQ